MLPPDDSPLAKALEAVLDLLEEIEEAFKDPYEHIPSRIRQKAWEVGELLADCED